MGVVFEVLGDEITNGVILFLDQEVGAVRHACDVVLCLAFLLLLVPRRQQVIGILTRERGLGDLLLALTEQEEFKTGDNC